MTKQTDTDKTNTSKYERLVLTYAPTLPSEKIKEVSLDLMKKGKILFDSSEIQDVWGSRHLDKEPWVKDTEFNKIQNLFCDLRMEKIKASDGLYVINLGDFTKNMKLDINAARVFDKEIIYHVPCDEFEMLLHRLDDLSAPSMLKELLLALSLRDHTRVMAIATNLNILSDADFEQYMTRWNLRKQIMEEINNES